MKRTAQMSTLNPELFKVYGFTFRTPAQAVDVATHVALLTASQYPYLELGLNELFLNAIEHGNLGITECEKETYKNTCDWPALIYRKLNLPENLSKKVTLTVEITASYTAFEIADEGEGFDWQHTNFKQPSPHKRHGRGILLASELCFDEIEYIDKGNIVRCVCWNN